MGGLQGRGRDRVRTGGNATSFAFTPDDNGSYEIRLTVFDADSRSATSGAFIVVGNVAPTATLSNNGPVNEGSAATVSFTTPIDPSLADRTSGFHYSYALTSSGLSSSYAAALDGASKAFTFDDNGTYAIFGRIFDKDGGFTDSTTMVIVNNVAPTATLSNSGPIDEGGSATVSFASPSDVSSTDTNAAGGFRYSYATSVVGLAQSYAAAVDGTSKSFSFADDGTFTVFGRIFDKDGGFTEHQTTVVVNNVAPTVALTTDSTDGGAGHSPSGARLLAPGG